MRGAFGLLVCLAIFGAGTVGVVVWAVERLRESEGFLPEVILPLIVITGVIGLLAALAIAASIFGLFSLSDREQALGLPAGSVQAVIALSLILIFAVVALYASGNSRSENFTSRGLTEAEYKAIPADQVVAVTRTVAGGGADGEATYDVVRAISNEDGKELNIQLLTTVSTLVVAVAGFYFGSKSVQEGSKSVQEGIEAATATARTLNVLEPPSPVTLKRSDPSLVIKLESTPSGAKLRSTIQGDAGGSLLNTEDDVFVYAPGRLPKPSTVTLNFEQIDDPKVSTTLVVELPEGYEPAAEKPPENPPGTAGVPAIT